MRKRAIGKRGQTALEFLTTYGWLVVILVILLIVMAFFANNADILIPSVCDFPSEDGITCLDYHAYEGGRLSLLLENSGETDVELLGAICIYEGRERVTTRIVSVDEERLAGSWSWRQDDFLPLVCEFDGDNPLGAKKGRKVDLIVGLTLQTPDGEVRSEAPVTVLVE